MYRGTLEYTVLVSEGVPGHAGFPETYEGFHESGAYVYEPLRGQLPRGTRQSFRLSVPGAEKVAVIMGDRWYHLDYRDGLFEGEATVTASEIQVGAKFPGSESYSVLLRYSSP